MTAYFIKYVLLYIFINFLWIQVNYLFLSIIEYNIDTRWLRIISEDLANIVYT